MLLQGRRGVSIWERVNADTAAGPNVSGFHFLVVFTESGPLSKGLARWGLHERNVLLLTKQFNQLFVVICTAVLS